MEKQENKAIMAVYSDNRILQIPDGVAECVILNGTKGEHIVLDAVQKKGSVTVKDCFGETAGAQETGGGLCRIRVPVSGQIYWRAVS